MSRSNTPTPVSSSSSSSRSSYRRLDSDTTPSPSGGNKSPTFNPRALSNRLALVEASQALAQASKTLSIAARAMSQAAASLAVVSGYDDDDYHSFGGECSEDVGDWPEPPDWAQPSYNLTIPAAPRDDSIRIAEDECNKSSNVDTISTAETIDSSIQPQCMGKTPNHTDNVKVHPSQPTPTAQTQPFTSHDVVTPEPPAVSTKRNSSVTLSGTAEPLPSTTPSNTKDKSLPDNLIGEPDHGRSASRNHAIAEATPVTPPHPSRPFQESSSSASSSNMPLGEPTDPTYIILEHGFDLLPALCYVTKRCTKTVCVYNYSGLPGVTQTATMLRANATLPVTMPESAKPDRMTAAETKFNSANSGILVWPGYKALPTIDGLVHSPNIQLIHLGEPTDVNAGVICSKTIVIMARSDLNRPQTIDIRYNRHRLDESNEICNQPGPESPLQSSRGWLRTRLAKDNYARGFYLDWILHRRKYNPDESLVEIVCHANRYAEEFLLRGESRTHGEPVGGQLTISETTARAQNFEPAIRAGVLLVS